MTPHPDRPVILGSASPRRRELLDQLGVTFVVRTAAADEESITIPDPGENVLARARLKAAALMTTYPQQGEIVLTADTTVAIDGAILNKPAHAPEAAAMLNQLRDRVHHVYSAVVVNWLDGAQPREASVVVQTAVRMRPYTEAEIDRYIATGDPFDKAGGYAIQHPVFRPVAELDGCYSSVVGLPLCETAALLRQATVHMSADPHQFDVQNWRHCTICQQLMAK